VEKLDLKDRKILYHLGLNSRESFRSIGKKVGLSKDIITSRVKKLQETRIINNFHTVVNYCLLGFTSYRFYLNFQYVTEEIKKEIVDYFISEKYIKFIHSIEGSFDFSLIAYARDLSKIYFIWEKVLSKYRDYFSNQVFSAVYKTSVFSYLFLLDKKDNEQVNRRFYDLMNTGKIVNIDKMDYDILRQIIVNSRMPTVEIAKNLNSTPSVINYRINKMINTGIIIGFKININFSKFGYRIFKVDINLKDHRILDTIINYIKTNPNLFEVMKSVGYSDIELVFILKNVNELHDIIADISKKFSDKIKNYTYFCVTHCHKWEFMPED
jgi:Lrp/AsnC family transcriptional regulator for asnA, asnC and gidA